MSDHCRRPGRVGSLRRRMILASPITADEARRARILRWIGAAARKRRKSFPAKTEHQSVADNVTRLTWAETCGRGVGSSQGPVATQAVVLTMTPHTRVLDRVG